MRILNRTHVPWAIFVVGATLFATWLYLGNFHRALLPMGAELPARWIQKTSDHRSVGGTPLGLAFGAIALGIFIFASLLGVRKKLVLWRVGTVQRWLRAHIWLTLLTIPLVFLHSGFRFGGPMTTLLVVLYVIVMVSGLYGLALQHQMPHIMMERLPAESVYEQIPHIRAQLVAAAQKLRDSFQATATGKTDAGAPSASAARTVTTGSTPMASTASALSTPTARAKTYVGSTITAEPLAGGGASTPAASSSTPGRVAATTEPPVASPAAKPAETMGTPTARVPEGNPVPTGTEKASGVAPAEVKPVTTVPSAAKAAQPNDTPSATVAQSAAPAKPAVPATPKPAAPATKAPAAPSDAASEAALADFLDRQILPYLSAIRGDRMRLGNPRFSEDTFRFVKLRVTPDYRQRVEEIQAWCDERRMLDLQTKLQHWLHGWLFVHAPVSFLLLIVTFWHAFVTLFHY